MTKQQKLIAKKLIVFIKENDGFVKSDEIIKSTIGDFFDFKTDIVVFNGLIELLLIEKIGNHSFRLTEKGWKFKSFRILNFNNNLQQINTKIILAIAIFTILLNLYKTFCN
jgi:hypothetical protein